MRLLLVLVLALLCTGGEVLAQIPPHYPGTICFTPNFWCWSSPGPAGGPCGCPSPYGWVQGFLG